MSVRYHPKHVPNRSSHLWGFLAYVSTVSIANYVQQNIVNLGPLTTNIPLIDSIGHNCMTELNLFQNVSISWNSRSKALAHFGIILSLNPSFSNSASLCESGVFRKISREPCRADQRCNVGKDRQHHSGHHIRYPGNLGSLLNSQKSGKYKLFGYY